MWRSGAVFVMCRGRSWQPWWRQLGGEPVLVCAPSLRPAVRRLVSAQTDGLPVLSYTEATAAALTIETVGVVRDIPAPAVGVVPAALG